MSPRRPPLGAPCRGRRPSNVIPPRQSFLIVCGGKRTERNYFNSFRRAERMATVRVNVHPIARSPLEIVEGARKLRTVEAQRGETYDQVWCVFDRDEFPGEDINLAGTRAGEYGMRVAYSNEAFELWYVLHFRYSDAPLRRDAYCAELDRLLGHEYDKASETMYAELESRLNDALVNARHLIRQYNPRNPANDNPSTTVHELVEQLLRYALPPARAR
jgi:hypothetical protein